MAKASSVVTTVSFQFIHKIEHMKLQKRTIAILTTLIAISLVGLVFLQYVLIANAIELKQQSFSQNVNAAMKAIVQNLETGEAVGDVYRVAVKEPQSVKPHTQTYRRTGDSMISVSVTTTDSDSLSRVFVSHAGSQLKTILPDHPPIRWEGERILYTVSSPQHVLIRAFNQSTGQETVIVNAFQEPGEHSIEVHDKTLARGEFTFKFLSDS